MNVPSNSTAAEPRAIPELDRYGRIAARAPIDAQLKELCGRFLDEAMTIDPSITGGMVYTDQIDHPSAIMGMFFRREAR